MEGTIRSLDKEIGAFIFNRMNDIVIATAKMFRGEAQLIELSSVPPLINDNHLAYEITNYMKDLVGEGSKQENPLFGAPMHSEKVVFNEAILATGAAIHAYSAIMWLKNNK